MAHLSVGKLRRQQPQYLFFLHQSLGWMAHVSQRVNSEDNCCHHNSFLLFSATQVGLDGTPEVLLDPNTLSKDGTSALSGVDFSKDGDKLAYGISKKGSDWWVQTPRPLADCLAGGRGSCDCSGNGYFCDTFGGTVAAVQPSARVSWWGWWRGSMIRYGF